jgi:PAS domain-containing protein
LTEVDAAELAELLDDVRRELGDAVDELDRSRAAHRTVESLLLALLEHVPVPIVVVDRDLRVRAASAEAERQWGVALDRPFLGTDGLAEACRAAAEAGYVAAGSIPEGYGAAMLDEPGTGERYIAAWRG